MTKVAIVTDSTAYIPKELVEEYDLHVAPLQLLWDHKSYRDGVDIRPEEFYPRLATSKTMPSTSQTTPAEFLSIYQRLSEEGKEILSIHISSLLSGTFDSAQQAKASLNGKANIELVDSLSAGMGLGFQALAAARAAHNGASLKEAKAIAEKAVQHTGVYFVVDTLEFLHRGGRIGGAQAFLGKLLDVKPILGLRNGKIEAIDKARTKKKAIERMLDLIAAEVGDKRPARLSVLHANVPDQAEALLEKACEKLSAKDVVEAFSTDVSPVIGTHIGPGGLGISYLAGM